MRTLKRLMGRKNIEKTSRDLQPDDELKQKIDAKHLKDAAFDFT